MSEDVLGLVGRVRAGIQPPGQSEPRKVPRNKELGSTLADLEIYAYLALTDNLQMGVRVADLCGHWKDELAKLEEGLVGLKKQRRDADPKAMTGKAPVHTISPARSFDDLFKVQLYVRSDVLPCIDGQ